MKRDLFISEELFIGCLQPEIFPETNKNNLKFIQASLTLLWQLTKILLDISYKNFLGKIRIFFRLVGNLDVPLALLMVNIAMQTVACRYICVHLVRNVYCAFLLVTYVYAAFSLVREVFRNFMLMSKYS
jgi:hypothetical protein